jgi:hypothetical protein
MLFALNFAPNSEGEGEGFYKKIQLNNIAEF